MSSYRDDDRTPPATPRRVTQRRQYDVGDLMKLAEADFSILLDGVPLTDALRERLETWLCRAWDLGRAAHEREETG